MVCLDPRKRITASAALKHPYFRVQPAPTEASKLPKPHIIESNSRKRVIGEKVEDSGPSNKLAKLENEDPSVTETLVKELF
jgi:serine/threonine protein kinase